MKTAATVLLMTLFSMAAFAQSEETVPTDPFSVFAPHRTQSTYVVDHQPWTDFLSTAVYSTGRSNRVAARRDDNTRITGSRASTGSTSRYRYEGNRVLFHLFDDGATDYVGIYRQALQDTINRIEYGDLSRDEQLAFWLNLYNAVVVHEIAKSHPISKPRNVRVEGSRESLFDAKTVSIHGIDLSLNDIRFNIIYRYWRNPNVIYGMWTGEIGSPNIRRAAYSGDNVHQQLENNAREFVNSLRGVDRIRGEVRVSQHYLDARPYFFTTWPSDLYKHLTRYAFDEVIDLIAEGPDRLRANKYASSTADVESGETVRLGLNDNPAAVAAGADLGSVWANLSGTGMRGGLSGEALAFKQRSDVRLEQRRGSVTILDVRTNEPVGANDTTPGSPGEDSDDATITDDDAE